MSSTPEQLRSAIKLHRAGNVEQARQLYEQILQSDPRHSDVLYFLGLVYRQTGQLAKAADYLRRAIEIDPTQAEYFGNLSEALHGLKQLPEAIDCCSEAARLAPQKFEAHGRLGDFLQEAGRLEEAIASYREAAKIQPRNVYVHFKVALLFAGIGRTEEAKAWYRRVIELHPGHVGAWINLGNFLYSEGQATEAVRFHREAVRLEPMNASTHCALGASLQGLEETKEAKTCYRRALELDPKQSVALQNLAAILYTESDFASAETHYRGLLDIAGEQLDTLVALAGVCLARQAPEAAWDYLDRALLIAPDDAETHFLRASILLTQGRLSEGWNEFEYRLHRRNSPRRSILAPRWDGSSLEGKTIFVHAEYGLGDALQFIRYVPRLQGQGGQVVVEVQPQLIKLLRQSGFTGLVGQGAAVPQFHFEVPLLSLPGIFGTTLENIPAKIPYLFADAKLVEKWRQRLRSIDGFKIGIHWQGSKTYVGDEHRSIPLSSFAPLARVPGVRLISLQKGFGTEQIAQVADQFPVVNLEGLDESEGAFTDTAAVMRSLNLVVTSDSAPVHLAGAMGIETWLALAAVADWRWLHNRDDSPWYPTLRLFRQSRLDDWSAVFERMAAELARQQVAGG